MSRFHALGNAVSEAFHAAGGMVHSAVEQSLLGIACIWEAVREAGHGPVPADPTDSTKIAVGDASIEHEDLSAAANDTGTKGQAEEDKVVVHTTIEERQDKKENGVLNGEKEDGSVRSAPGMDRKQSFLERVGRKMSRRGESPAPSPSPSPLLPFRPGDSPASTSSDGKKRRPFSFGGGRSDSIKSFKLKRNGLDWR
ncbi:hypothetical protein NSK_004529 [Nannochloropsis salina CCMP1776]|jgi:hypothetical protein|uniref:Uncharacterized protein n=1 Tax=Nannochloropsis salina CCMP1776 TaxID=1027361 RepID=A0A4D9D3M8_9STRA|nr:hypothetical protein NSK_004529 [Nannochloropsis salina CCMP1776]|eukprot:TFJ84055.1 hypothetical protein NSK_004529 [Nannochloropsis salina CCMP1776]